MSSDLSSETEVAGVLPLVPVIAVLDGSLLASDGRGEDGDEDNALRHFFGG